MSTISGPAASFLVALSGVKRLLEQMPKASEHIRKVAVIGTINRDTVIRADGTRHEGYGGILYNLAALSALAPENAVIFPVVNIGTDCAKQILRQLHSLRRLNLEAARLVDRPNNHCLLRYSDATNKTEMLTGWVGGVSRAQLKTVTDSDLIHVNFISGADISGNNLRWLRGQARGIIMMDFHSRTLGRHRDGRRYLRRPPDWRDYLACADIVQMNEIEFQLLSGLQVGETACREFMARALQDSQCLIVTCGVTVAC